MAEEMVTLDWSNEEELLKEEAEEEKKAEQAEKKTEEQLLAEDKKDGAEAMDTSTDQKEEEKKENEWEKTLLTSVLRGAVKVTNVQIKDLLSKELQQVLHKSMNTQIDFSSKKGIIHLNFLPNKERTAVDILRRLAKFQYANKEVKIQCSRAVACLLGYELRRQGVGPAPPGTLQFDKVLFLYDIPPETTEEVLRAMFDCPICIIPLDEEGNNLGAAFLEFRSKKAAKACYNDNTEIEIGDVKCTLHNKYLVGGKKEDDEDEKHEQEKKRKEQDRKAKEGQQKRNQNQKNRSGAGKSFNRGLAVKQKYNQARQMGAFGGNTGGYGGGGGGGGNRMGMGMGSGMNQGGGGVSPNLMMNQMMAMMRMSQNMGGDGMGMGGGNMGSGMNRGMGMGNRMGGQRAMSANNFGGGGGGMGFDDFSGDYGFDDYESGYGQGRNMGMGNMGGRRQPQSLMGGNRRGSFGSGQQKDSVVDLFESALDAVDSQMGNRDLGGHRDEMGGQGNRNRQQMGRGGMGREGRQSSGKIGSLMDMGFDSGSRSAGGGGGRAGKFDTPANQRIIKLAGNYNESDLAMAGGDDFGGPRSSRFGRESQDMFAGDNRRGSGGRDSYDDFNRGYDDNYGKVRENPFRREVGDNYGRERYDDYVKESPRHRDDAYREDSFGSRNDPMGVDRSQPVGYPDIYKSKGSTGMSEMLGYKKPKRTFTEQPMKRTYDDYVMDTRGQEFGSDDFVFKKPNLTSLPGRNQQMNKGQRGGGRQNNSGMSAPRSLMDGFNQGPARKTY